MLPLACPVRLRIGRPLGSQQLIRLRSRSWLSTTVFDYDRTARDK